MGRVKEPTCASRSGQLAMDALGRLDESERADLAAHLADCDVCRATSAELTSTARALDALTEGASSVPAPAIPPHLYRAVVSNIGSGGDVSVRGTWLRRVALAGVSIAAVVVAAVAVTLGISHTAPQTQTMALQGGRGVTAIAVLEAKPWGTSLTIREQGLAPGETYTVSMDDPHGRWWTAGSYRTTGSAPVEATMACAAQFASIYEIRVTDSNGRTVLTNEPHPT